MIKAEVITHEGNPGPNWLDQCKTLISPARSTALVLVIGVAVLLTVIVRGDGAGPVTEVSQQATPARSLSVEPLKNPSATNSTAELNLQSPTSSTNSTVDQSPGAANALGAQRTPSLNNSTTPAGSSQQPQPVDQTQLNNRNLTNTVQSTVKDLDSSLKSTVDGVTKSLKDGLFGL